MINSVHIVGRLGKDPEVRTAGSGIKVAKFSLAISEFRGKGNDRKELTHWIDCTAFGGVAEAIEKYVKKGHKLSVQGRLNQNKWEDKESGQKRSKLEVIAENVEFMNAKDSNGGGNGGGKKGKSSAEDDDIPF